MCPARAIGPPKPKVPRRKKQKRNSRIVHGLTSAAVLGEDDEGLSAAAACSEIPRSASEGPCFFQPWSDRPPKRRIWPRNPLIRIRRSCSYYQNQLLYARSKHHG